MLPQAVLRLARYFSTKPLAPISPVSPATVPLTGIPSSPSGLYAMFFTCKVCNTRSGKTFSKHSYHSGVVLIRCDCCNKLHLVADNLGWFRDKKVNIEDLMREKGEDVVKLAKESPVFEYVLAEKQGDS